MTGTNVCLDTTIVIIAKRLDDLFDLVRRRTKRVLPLNELSLTNPPTLSNPLSTF